MAVQRIRRFVVRLVTNQKVIQATMTAAAFGTISKFSEGLAVHIETGLRVISGVGLPQQYFTSMILLVIAAVSYWADRNTEEWRRFIEDATGEEASDEDVEDGDGD